MKHFYLLFFLSAAVCAQSIDYTVDLIDVNRRPVYHRYLQQTHEVTDGVYLKYGFGLNTAESTISYFNGQNYWELYTSPSTVRIVGATSKGAFALETIDQEPFGQFLLFVSKEGNVDTLNSRQLPLPHTFQLGETLYTFSNATGVITYTATGEETVVTKDYHDCICNTHERYYVIGEHLIYNNRSEYFVTDGTAAGTKRVFDGDAKIFVLSDRAVFQGGPGLLMYDPTTESTTDLLSVFNGMVESVHGISVTSNGLIVKGTGPEEDALYVTDGTAKGTTKLASLGNHSGQSGEGIIKAFGDYVVFQEELASNSRRYWLTDGSVAGTRFVLDIPPAQFGNGVAVDGYSLSNGDVLLAFFSSNLNKSFVYSVNVSKTDRTATLVSSVPFDIKAGEPRVINNRLLVGGSYLTDELYSFGITAGDLQYVGKLDVTADLLYTTKDEIFYLNSEYGPEAIYVSRALAGDLERILPVESGISNEMAYASLFSIKGNLYAHTFDPQYGEAIFVIDEELTPKLVVDLYPNSAGNDIIRIFGLDDKVLWTTRGRDEVDSYLSNGTPTGTTELADEAGLPYSRIDKIGSIGTRHYFFESSLRTGLYEFDAATVTTRKFEAAFQSAISNPVMIDGLIYAVLEDPKPIYNQQIRQLIAFNPLTDQITVIKHDTTMGTYNRGFQSIATDGKVLYFTTAQEGRVGPSVYDPAKESVVHLGRVDAQTVLNYRRFGDRVVVDYNRLPYGKAARLLSLTELGPAFQIELPEFVEGVALESGFITMGVDGILYSIDYSNGQGTALTQQPVDVLEPKTFVKVAPNKAVLFWKYGDENAIWQTDGSSTGTKALVEGANPIGGAIVAVQPFGDLLVVLTPHSLNLLDPPSGIIQAIAVQIESPWPQPPLAVVGDRLYFSAVNPVYGQELHYLTAGEVHAPTTSTKPTAPEITVRVYPNPTSDWLYVENQRRIPLAATLYDGTGRIVASLTPTEQPTLDLAALPSGIYFLHLQKIGEDSRAVYRVVRR